MFSKKLATLAVAASVGLFASAASHAVLLSFSDTVVPGTNTYSDDNAELVLKHYFLPNGGGVAGGVGYRAFDPTTDVIEVNDILIGMVHITSFPTAPDQPGGSSSALYNEITAVYAVQAITATDLSEFALLSCGNALLTSCTGYTFSAATLAGAADPLNEALKLSNSIYGTTFVTNFANTGEFSFATLLEDDTPDFTRTGTLAETSATASDGDQLFVFDLNLGEGDFFTATGPENVAQLAFLPLGANAGNLGGSSTVSYQNVPGWEFGPRLEITGNIQRPGAGAWPIWSDSTYTLQAQRVPEPATLALLGLGLAGLGFGRRFGRKSVEA